jgi:outer membrane lipopolysaccharide assembly protein LptE/RlpB
VTRARRYLTALAALLPLLASGCGYHIAGRADLMPKNIKVIAVPAFGNVTTRYELARQLPADIIRELIARTRYTVVADPNQADAVLTGVLANYFAYPITADPISGRATGVQVIVVLNLTLTDRHSGAVLYFNPGAEFQQRYEISVDPKAYFDESSTALARLSRDVARSAVSGILEVF